ncbi:hypothetical protein PC116_g33467 [Phytophthora cactorum]|nr:hypothetical protein PC116_g33467 [Phytophthora cactorum]
MSGPPHPSQASEFKRTVHIAFLPNIAYKVFTMGDTR